jgi:hypothetical protein
MAKDDVVIGLGRPMYGSSVHANRKKAYPSVITTLGQMEPEARRWIAVHNFLCSSYLDSDRMKKTYVAALCNDSEPASDTLKAAYKKAEIQHDRKKHIRFQVRVLFLLGWSLEPPCRMMRRSQLADRQHARVLRGRGLLGHRVGASEHGGHGCLRDDWRAQDRAEWRVPHPHQRSHMHLL